MEKLSRVKKYEELRKSIEVDNNIDNSLHANKSVEQEEALKKFDSSIFKKVDIQEDSSYTPEREKEIDGSQEHKPLVDDTFTNEYLDDFIKEVRDYNIKKGNRESENTQADILYQLNASNRAKRSQYIQEIKDDLEEESKKLILNKDNIALQVASLLQEDMDEQPSKNEHVVEKEDGLQEHDDDMTTHVTRELNMSQAFAMEDNQDQEELSTPQQTVRKEEPEIIKTNTQTSPVKPVAKKVIAPLIDEDFVTDEIDKVIMDEKPKDAMLQKKLLEETQQLRVQMNEYEDELTDLSDGVEKTNKLLNFVLCFLILVLLIIIGFIVYTLWKSGGI